MSRQHKINSLPPQEYLALERKAQYKSEYFDGEVFAMTGSRTTTPASLHP